LVHLQSGDAEALADWREMVALSCAQFDAIYQRLGVTFDHTLGESFYHPRLKPLVDELVAKAIARESEGAIAVFFEDLPQLKEHPALIQKSDGAFNYTTTDLATLAYRLDTWRPDEILYVTDARQQLHFQQLFAVFRRWRPEAEVNLVHVWFGSILGDDGKPFKTRSGDTIKLSDLLDEAEERAFKVVKEKSPELSDARRREIARIVGIGAVKYADLLPNRQSDYVFSWDKLLALNGNTAPYLQYAYARIRSIFRKGNVQPGAPPVAPSQSPGAHYESPASLRLAAPEELALARHLLNFGLVLEAVTEDYRPNFLCNYLYELAGRFTSFYENCPVLKSEAEQRACRLALCDLTARVLKQGLDVLGIETLEQM
jgi:arginyl-tRNA synthetase